MITRTYGGPDRPIPEDESKCIKKVYAYGIVYRQCSRNRGYGPDKLYCKDHGAKEAQKR